jgi:hypothetical protein
LFRGANRIEGVFLGSQWTRVSLIGNQLRSRTFASNFPFLLTTINARLTLVAEISGIGIGLFDAIQDSCVTEEQVHAVIPRARSSREANNAAIPALDIAVLSEN